MKKNFPRWVLNLGPADQQSTTLPTELEIYCLKEFENYLLKHFKNHAADLAPVLALVSFLFCIKILSLHERSMLNRNLVWLMRQDLTLKCNKAFSYIPLRSFSPISSCLHL